MKSFLRLSFALLAVLFVSCTVSPPELKVNEGPEIKIKVGETKKLNVSGSGINCFSVGYSKGDGFQVSTSDMIVKVDNESLSITGQYVGKCKLAIHSENGESVIAVNVEPNYPLWEHGLVFEKVKNLSIDSIVQELGFNYTTKKDETYIFDNISDKILSFGCNDQRLLYFVIPISQKEYVQKSLQEYGTVNESPIGSMEGTIISFFHNNATIKQTVRTHHMVPVFWVGYAIQAYYCDDVICLSLDIKR